MLRRLHIRSLPGVLFGILVLLLALGNCWLGVYPYGTEVWIRPLLSLMGVAGAICWAFYISMTFVRMARDKTIWTN